MEYDGQKGVYFAVWAPNAKKVTVIGDFNQWNKTKNPLHARGSSGIWEGFMPGVEKGTLYKYHIISQHARHKAREMRPGGLPCRGPAQVRLRGLGPGLPVERRGLDEGAQGAQRPRRAGVHLRDAPGVLDARARGRQPLADLPGDGAQARGATCGGWALRTSSSCRSWSTRSPAPGATSPSAISRPPRASARRRTSCIWWTTCTRRASA